MTLPVPTELEIKLLVPPGAEAAVADHPLLRGAEAPRVQHHVTTYFDTPGWDLSHMGASLRIRRRGGTRVQTLKLRDPAGQAFARGEWEWPVATDAPDLALLAETPIAALLAAMPPFAPVFATEIERRLHVLDHEGARIEVAFDRGRVVSGSVEEPIQELELELKSGPPAALLQLAAQLQASLPLCLGAESKGERGWRLATGRPRAAARASLPPLARDVAAGEAWQRILGALLAGLLANLPAATAGEAEGIHQMRATVRRLRGVLALFRPLLERDAVERFDAGLRDLGRVLGMARDWDVFCTETLPQSPQGPLFREAAEAARGLAHRELAAALAGSGLATTLLGLAAWSASARLPAGPLAAVLPGLEARLARRVRRRARHLRRQGPEQRHRLRKALKRLRDALAALAPLHRKQPLRAWLATSAPLSAQLGLGQDARVAVALAGRLEVPAPALAEFAAWAEARAARAGRRLPEAWRRLKAMALPD